jgi:hypothetical protein
MLAVDERTDHPRYATDCAVRSQQKPAFGRAAHVPCQAYAAGRNTDDIQWPRAVALGRDAEGQS